MQYCSNKAIKYLVKTHHFKASKALQPYISRYWVWSGQTDLPTMLPGTGAELMFNCGKSLALEQENHPISNTSESMLLLPRKNRFNFKKFDHQIKFIAVRFRHSALRHFCSVPIIEMIDQNLSAIDLWGKEGQHIEERIADTPSLTEKIKLLNHFLQRQLNLHKKNQHLWLDHALYQLYYQPSELNLDAVINQSEVSTRYFQKIFKQNTGVSPKHFQCTARFEHILRKLLLSQTQDYLDLALDYGYYDQAHFIKEFKQYTTHTPSNFLQEKNFRTHFYNAPLST